jgi:hypothetical protein
MGGGGKYQRAPWNGKQSRGKGLRGLVEEKGRRQAADPRPGRLPAATLVEVAAPLRREGRGCMRVTVRVALTPTLFDPGRNH